MPERPTGRAPQLRAGRGLRSLRPRAQKVVETKVQSCDGAAHKSSRLAKVFAKRYLGGIFSNTRLVFFKILYLDKLELANINLFSYIMLISCFFINVFNKFCFNLLICFFYLHLFSLFSFEYINI